MAFLNPLVLIALAAAAIPLLIHLFNFRRARRIDYSSLRFLKELRRSTLQRVRLKRWLLLLFRTLAVLCLIAAFARPVLVGSAFTGDAKVSMAVVIDNSLSMMLRDTRGTYLDQARTHARSLAEAADEAFVLLTAGGPVAGGAAALDILKEVAPDARAMTALEAIERAAALLQREGTHLNREVYFVGDLQRSMLADTSMRPVPEAVRVTLVPVGGRVHENVAVEAVDVRSRIVEVGEPVRIQATLRSYRAEAANRYVASLYIAGARVAQQTVDLQAGARQAVSFMAAPAARGWLTGRVQGEDDAFSADNTHHFALHVPATRHVLIVRDPGAPTEFLALALKAGDDAMEIETIDRASLARTKLGAYDAVLLVGPRHLSSGEVAALTRYAGGGGGLLLFPGDERTDFNVLLKSLGGGHIRKISVAEQSGMPVATVTHLDKEHALFEGVFEDPSRMEQPAVYRAADYVPGTGTEQTLLSLSNGRPFLQEVRVGQGLALMFVVGPDPSWSDLPIRGLFVPLVHRAVHYLAAGESVQGNRLVAGRPVSIRLGNLSGRVHMRTPLQEEVTPRQRSLIGATVMEVGEEHGVPGVYDVLSGGVLVRRMAMNTDPRESDLAVAPPPEAERLMAAATGVPVRTVRAGAQGDLVQRMRQDRVGVELWRVFVVLTLVFLGLEMLTSVRHHEQAA